MLKELNGVNKFNQKEYAEINFETKAYFFYKISDDGLLTSSREKYYIIDKKLILLTMIKNDKFYGVEIEDELSNYFINLISMNWFHKDWLIFNILWGEYLYEIN